MWRDHVQWKQSLSPALHAVGDFLRWEPSDVSRITIYTITTNSDLNVPVMQSGYTVTLIAFNDTTLTSTLSRTAENGITVSCVGLVPTLTTIVIRLVGKKICFL